MMKRIRDPAADVPAPRRCYPAWQLPRRLAIPPPNTTPDQVETRIDTPFGDYSFTLAVYGARWRSRYDRHRSWLCRRAHRLNSCAGECHGIICLDFR